MTAEFAKLKATWESLARTGHAVLLDSTVDSQGKLVRAVIHHYLSCRVCEGKCATSLE